MLQFILKHCIKPNCLTLTNSLKIFELFCHYNFGYDRSSDEDEEGRLDPFVQAMQASGRLQAVFRVDKKIC